MIRLAWTAILVLATLTVLVLLWQFSVAVVLFLLSLAAAAAFRPLIETLGKWVPHKGWALVISAAVVISVFAALILVMTGPLISDLQQVVDDIFITYERLKNSWQLDQSPLVANLAAQLPPTQALYDVLVGGEPRQAVQAVFGLAEGTFTFLGRLAIVMVLSLYWSADHIRFERLWLSLLPVESRSRARTIWQAIETGIGAYLRREFILSFLGAVCLWAGYQIMGIHYALLLAVVGALARLIPWMGPALVVIFPLLVGSALGQWAGMAAAAYTIMVLVALEITLGARVLPRSRYSSLLLVLVMIALGESFGILGVILAPLLAVAIQILSDNLLHLHFVDPNGLQHMTVTGLYEKLESIKQMSSSLDGLSSSETASLTTRLEQLLEKSLSIEKKS